MQFFPHALGKFAADPDWISEPIAFTRTREVDLGHLNPVPLSPDSLSVLADHARALSDACQKPIPQVSTASEPPDERSVMEGLACLLRSGALRERYAIDPKGVLATLHIRAEDLPTFAALTPNDLEFQARILLRKRFTEVQGLLPQTCAALGDQAWTVFQVYAREHWPSDAGGAVEDALSFHAAAAARFPRRVCDPERNRLRFRNSNSRLRIYWVRDASLNSRCPYGIQILVRFTAREWRDWTLHLGL